MSARTSVVAVAPGEVLAREFRSRGAERIVSGGRTMNPSVGELFDAVQSVSSDEVLILTNDEHVISAARQVPKLTAKSVHVVPTTGLCEGLVAMGAFDPAAPVAKDAEAMTRVSSRMRSAQIDRAIRESVWERGRIHPGEWVAYDSGHAIIAVRSDIDGALDAAAEALVVDNCDLTLVEGEGADRSVTERFLARLTGKYPGVTHRVIAGGDAVPPYVMAIRPRTGSG